MISLALSILSGVTFLQFLRKGQQQNADGMVLIWANYVVAAVLSLVLIFATGEGFPRVKPIIVTAGVINGTLYVVHLLIVVATVRLAGTGVASAVMGSGNLVGVLLAWILWGEALSPWQWGAVGILPVALLLMRGTSGGRFQHTPRTDGILLANFSMIGVISTIHKGVSLTGIYQERAVYQFVIFAVATVLTTILIIRNGRSPRRADIILGAAAGVVNVTSTLFLLVALNALLAVVVLPTRSALNILLSLALGWLLWREALTRRQLMGAGLAIVTVILANLS